VLFLLLFVAAITAVGMLPNGALSDIVLAVVLIGGLTVGHVAYFVLLQRRHGRTPGKALVGIRVVDAAARPPSAGALIKRTVPLLVEYFYVIAWVAMMSSPYRQRFGDRWGDTFVVRDP
jgi:uncharacterized RDD family membrane protein YckC